MVLMPDIDNRFNSSTQATRQGAMDNSSNYIFLPLLVQVLLTLALFIYLAIAKSRSVKQGTVDLNRRALHSDAWPESVQQINNNIRNQFEVPVLFYVLVIVLYVLQSVSLLTLVLAWLFAISRLLHAYIHIGSNYVPYRRSVFTIGCLLLIAMLVQATYAVVTSGV